MQLFARIGVSTDITEHIVRKLAHFTEFTALGMLLSIDTALFFKENETIYMGSVFCGLISGSCR